MGFLGNSFMRALAKRSSKGSQRTSLKRTREIIHKTLDDIAELEGLITDDYLEWVYDQLHEPKDPTMALFKRARLNPNNPKHWVVLLSYLVEAIYTERRGAPVVWTPTTQYALLRRAHAIRVSSQRMSNPSDLKTISKALKSDKRFGKLKTGTYKGSDRAAATIQREIERALDSIEDEFLYPARTKDLAETPALRKQFETWLDALRPEWRSRPRKKRTSN
jgi:hypothetical protein